MELQERDSLLRKLRSKLLKAQEQIKVSTDKKRCDVQFVVGGWVYVKLWPYRQHSMSQSKAPKLSKRFSGPFEVLKKLGEVAYRLVLSAGS